MENRLPKFLHRLHQILDNPEYADLLSWDTHGLYIIIKDQSKVHKLVIPIYFKLKKFSSFIRQLHLYDFHKLKSSRTQIIFYNDLFQREDKELGKKIVRKRKTKGKKTDQGASKCEINDISEQKSIEISRKQEEQKQIFEYGEYLKESLQQRVLEIDSLFEEY